MDLAAVFIDGGYLDHLQMNEFKGINIDYHKLAVEIAKPCELLRAYYYHCLPYQSNPPTEEEREKYSSMRKFVDALKRLPRFEVRLGRVKLIGHNSKGDPIYLQKRIDCMVGVDMTLLAGKGRIETVDKTC